jgi:DNA-directed RNA polymerase subunit omega
MGAAEPPTNFKKNKNKYMNAELVKQALAKVLDPHVLVNMVSRRVRQLNSGEGGASRPLVLNTTNQGAADIALREIIEDKMSFDMPEIIQLTRPTARGRKKPQSWGKAHAPKGGLAA